MVCPAQLTFTCSNSTTEPVEKGVKYVQIWIYLTPFSSVSIVDFKQVSISPLLSVSERCIDGWHLVFACSKFTI